MNLKNTHIWYAWLGPSFYPSEGVKVIHLYSLKNYNTDYSTVLYPLSLKGVYNIRHRHFINKIKNIGDFISDNSIIEYRYCGENSAYRIETCVDIYGDSK